MSIFRYQIEKIVEGYFFAKISIYVSQKRYEESLGDAHLEALSGHYIKSSMAAGGGGAGQPSVLLRHYTPIIAAVHAYAFDVVCYGEG